MGRLEKNKRSIANQGNDKISPRKAYLSFIKKRVAIVFIAFALISSSLAVAFSPIVETANAKSESEMNLNEKALSYATLNALKLCVRDEGNQQADNEGFVLTYFYISDANAKAGKWWRTEGNAYWVTTDGAARSGSYLNSSVRSSDKGGDGKATCNSILSTGLSLWGYSSALDLLCDAGVPRADGSPCREGADRFGTITDYADEIYNTVVSKVYGGKTPSLYSESIKGYPGRYLLYKSAFETGCMATPSASQAGNNFTYSAVKVVGEDGTITDTRYVGGIDSSNNRPVYIDRDNLNEVRKSCKDLASEVNNYASDYAKYRKNNPNEPPPGESALCATNPTDPSCEAGGSTSCNIPSLGWILCPIISTGASIADAAYGFLADSFLQFDSALINTDPNATITNSDGTVTKVGTGTYSAWQVMQSIANVAFVIVFLIIIFSQLTGIGVSQYGVKKTLPRIVIAAILVNVSFIICQLAVDASNLLGFGLKEILTSVADRVTADGASSAASATDESSNLAGIALLIIAGGAAVSWIGVGAVLIAIIGAIVSLLTIFLLLIARKAILVLLIVLAPLAFVAYLLPNTEHLFQKWRKLFTTLLLLFPLIGLLYGACILASSILMGVAGTDVVMKIAAYIVLVVPLVAIIPLLKSSLNSISSIGGSIQNLGKRIQGTAKNATKAGYENSRLGKYEQYRKGVKSRRKAQIMGGSYEGKGGVLNPRNLGSQINSAINNNTGRFGSQISAAGIALTNKEEADAISASEQKIRSDSVKDVNASQKALVSAMRSGNTVMAKAAQNVMFTQGSGAVGKFYETVKSTSDAKASTLDALRENINEKHGQYVKSKAADITNWAAKGGSISDPGHVSALGGMAEAELAGQTSATLERAKAHINPSTAQSLLNNKQLNGNLDAEQLRILKEVAGNPTVAPTTNIPSTSSSSAPFVVGGNGSISIPHNNNNNSGTPPPTTP
jgi:hypothetical protein